MASTGTQASAVRSQTDEQIDAVVSGRNADPFGVLGPQPVEVAGGRRWVIRFFHPRAVSASVVVSGVPGPIAAKKIRAEGFFEAALPDTYRERPEPANYRLRFANDSGHTWEMYDAYAFPFLLSEFDLYLMGEGRHYELQDSDCQ